MPGTLHQPSTHCIIHQHYHLKQSSTNHINCALTKQGERFLTSITNSPVSATDRLINKFVSSSSKAVTLSTLSHLLSPHTTHPYLSSLALPLYMKITQESWFTWNPKLVASVIASLYKQGRVEEAEGLVAQNVSAVCLKERDLVLFYGNLCSSLAKLKSESGFSSTTVLLKELVSRTSSSFVRRRAYESLIGGHCVIGQPQEGKKLIDEMRQLGIKPSLFEFRSLLEGYGKLGLFQKMRQTISEMENDGLELDTISSNMVLSSYGLHNEHSEMALWLRKVKASGIGFSIRTYNSVLNSCPALVTMLQDTRNIPVSLKGLLAILKDDEASLVQELTVTLVIQQIMTWDSLESKLDLHGMHVSTSYIIMLQWMEELRLRFTSGLYDVPVEIRVVCGTGKHSNVRAESPVKALVREIMIRTRSPLRIDRKNIGCFIAKGKAVEDWLNSLNEERI